MNDVVQAIHAYSDFLLISHVSPDGDTLGSALALRLALIALGKTAIVVCEDPVPESYRALPGASEVRLPEDESPAPCAIAIDVSDLGRLGRCADLFTRATQTICIDHHATNPGFAQINVIDPHAGATGELIFDLIDQLGVPWTRDMAGCLYTALCTDTGNFQFPNTRPETLRCAAKLLETGLNVSELTRRLFRTRPFSYIQLLGCAIDSLRMYDRVASMRLTQADFERCGAESSQCEGIVRYAIEIQGISAAAMLREGPDGTVKASLRSIQPVDVSRVAQIFGGGGHAQAAGCTLALPIEQAENKIVQALIQAVAAEEYVHDGNHQPE